MNSFILHSNQIILYVEIEFVILTSESVHSFYESIHTVYFHIISTFMCSKSLHL